MLAEAIAIDWVSALNTLPFEAVNEACTEYVRTKTAKPKPADIIKLARSYAAKHMPKASSVNLGLERQAVQLLEESVPYSSWPRDVLDYKVRACGGLQFSEFVIANRGWFRGGGGGIDVLVRSTCGK